LHQTKKLLQAKESSAKWKDSLQNRRKNFANSLSNKGLMSRINKELKNSTVTKSQIIQMEMGK
jgi:hypothetical protein